MELSPGGDPTPFARRRRRLLPRRRILLLAGAALGVGTGTALVACTPPGDGDVPPSVPPTPTPTPTPPDPWQQALAEAATAERAVARRCRELVAGYDWPDDRRAALTAIAGRHTDYAAVLGGADPLGRRPEPAPPSPTAPTPTPATPTPTSSTPGAPGAGAALQDLLTAADALVVRHDRAARAGEGLPALLWASLAAAAGRDRVIAESGLAVAADDDGSVAGAVWASTTDDEAAVALLAGVHAGVWGYQVALSRLRGSAAERPATRLDELRLLRDEVTALLTDRDTPAPGPEPDYDPGTAVDSSASAVRLLAGIETRLQPLLGGWVPVADADGRRLAVPALRAAARSSTRWGATPARWPGWPD